MKQLNRDDVIEFYSRKDVMQELLRCAKNKEAIGSYNAKGYAKRPDTLNYKQEIIDQINNGITSFHFSEETWENVYNIKKEMTKKDLNNLRKGWDLVIDIDSKNFEISKIAANLIIKAIKYHDIDSVTCKFSGNNGFHIAIPYEAFPKQVHNKETRLLFPELPRYIAAYINNMIKDKLREEIINQYQLHLPPKLKEFVELIDIELKDLIIHNELDVDKIIKIDTILINSRHLCRMTYSINEKSGLVSIPVELDKIMDFIKENATPESIIVKSNSFLRRDNVKQDEAKQLLLHAMDYNNARKMAETITKDIINEGSDKKHYDETKFTETIRVIKDAFPPCMNIILNGVDDGRKRTLFLLMNFLCTVGYDYDEIKEIVSEWNSKNREPLRQTYIKSQLQYVKKNKRTPPNCSNPLYCDLEVCKRDKLCSRIRNPAGYAVKKHMYLTLQAEENKKREEKEKKKAEKKVKKKKKLLKIKEIKILEDQTSILIQVNSDANPNAIILK